MVDHNSYFEQNEMQAQDQHLRQEVEQCMMKAQGLVDAISIFMEHQSKPSDKKLVAGAEQICKATNMDYVEASALPP